MGLLARGQAALIARQQQAATSDGPLVYVRGAERIDLTGVAWVNAPETSRLPNTSAPGAAVAWSDRDYLIPTAALPWEPQKGDRIEETIDGQALRFEVLPPTSGEREWRFTDAGCTLRRVHTKSRGVVK